VTDPVDIAALRSLLTSNHGCSLGAAGCYIGPKTTRVLREAIPALLDELEALRAAPSACTQCGKPVEPERECYAIPTCYACLPPPKPLKTVALRAAPSEPAMDDLCIRTGPQLQAEMDELAAIAARGKNLRDKLAAAEAEISKIREEFYIEDDEDIIEELKKIMIRKNEDGWAAYELATDTRKLLTKANLRIKELESLIEVTNGKTP